MINYRINGDFYGNARSVIKGSEGFRGDIYSDTVSIPTIGYGYALIVRQRKSNGTMNYVVADYVQNEFASIGIAPTPAQMNLLRDIAIDLTNGNTAAARTKTATLDAQIRDIDQAEASTLFNRSLDRALADVKRGFIASLGSANGELLFTEMTGSTELVAISSMAFSGGSDIVGRSLSQALWNSNRAEAWYEIRYNSNNGSSRSPGIAKRRYYESELFGIYNNSASVQVDEAKEVFRMFSLHRSDIERYEQRYGVDFDGNAGWDRINGRPPLGAANYEFNLSGAAAVDAIHDALSPAWTALFAELQRLYPTGMAGLSATDFSPVNVQLDPNRNAGQPVTTNTQDHQSYLDGRRFNSQGQEISTRDVLIGEGGRDTLRGGLGDDVLIGGEGDDIYIYRAGDGNDRIIDSDRRGRVIVFDANGQHRELAAGAFFQQNPNGGTIWQSADGQISITHNSPWRLVLSDGSTIELGDFQDGDFGIDLINAPVPVDYTRTIQGDREWQVFYAPAELEEGASPLPSGGPMLPGDEWTVTVNHPVNPQDPAWANWRIDQAESVLLNTYDYLGWTVNEYRITSATWAYNRIDDLGNIVRNDQVRSVGDILNGSQGNDRILTGEGYGEVHAMGGDDRVEMGSGEDYAEGGAGADIVVGRGGHNFLFGQGGDDILYANQETDPAAALTQGQSQSPQDGESSWLDGGDGDDRLTGDAGSDVLLGGAGGDLILGGGGNDHLAGDEEGHLVPFYLHSVSYHAWHYTNTLSNGTTLYWYRYDAENEVALRPGGDDALYGGAGEDWLFGQGGDDYLDGGADADVVFGDEGDDTIAGGGGDDFLSGDTFDNAGDPDNPGLPGSLHGQDYIEGGAGDDRIAGNGGDDVLYGDEGKRQSLQDGSENCKIPSALPFACARVTSPQVARSTRCRKIRKLPLCGSSNVRLVSARRVPCTLQ